VTDNDVIPSNETYRDVPIAADQPRVRIDSVVIPEINLVYGHAHDLRWLREYFAHPGNAPEARFLAAVLVRSAFDLAVKERRERPTEISASDFDLADGFVRLLSGKRARSSIHYALRFDTQVAPGQKRSAPREVPLAD
jgi:hypothetical protein